MILIFLQAFRKYNEGSVVALLDPLMQEAVKTDVAVKMFDLAFNCAAPVRSDRPDMKTVGEQLWAIRQITSRVLVAQLQGENDW